MSPENGAADVVLAGVRKSYGAVEAVRGVSLEIPRGAFFALLGPSGCGKTTTLRLIAGFEQPSQGEVYIRGARVTAIPPFKRDFAMVFQNFALFPHLSVARNVAFGLRMRRIPRAEREERVREALALVKLGGFEARYPKQLSGGQQQRVALARAIVVRPAVLLLDEPLGALDKNLREAMQVELRELQRRLGITTVFVTHDQEEALTMSDQVAVMKDGVIEQLGPPREVYERPRTEFVAGFLGVSNLVDGRVLACANGMATIDSAWGRLEVPATGREAGEAVRLALRPERVRILRGEEAGGLQARLREVVYRGSVLHLFLESGGAGLVAFLPNASPDAVSWKPGDLLRWTWQAGSLVMLDRKRSDA
jgi:putative spermidine/putrescine transport system ATP-binding protein/spermidine/putrescine transport system ATP-binding protein